MTSRSLGVRGRSQPPPKLGHSLGVCLLVWAASFATVQADDSQAVELFETKVRPILVERCQGCHGAKKQWASLRLDSHASLLQGGDTGPAVVPGKPDESELIARVTEEDESLRMPPEEAGKPLTKEQIAALTRWIELGAPWPDSPPPPDEAQRSAQRAHWAFQPVQEPAIPDVEQKEWAKNPIDHFILARLEAAQLKPSPAADRRTLVRRVTYDLTGLPPTPEEVEAFVEDESPDAYERLIDRLLASPRYGEQWGRYWLDLARYSDTKGYVYGREERFFVHSSVYRDWVVKALNDDMPYDRFVLLQLAADQVVEENSPDLAAMGFLTTGRRFLGVAPDIIDDRIDVVSRGLMGLTVTCARCHDHKYDPIPTADYYALYGVFQNCTEQLVPVARDPNVPPPTAEFEKELAARKAKLQETLTLRREEAGSRIRQRIAEYLLAQRELEKYPTAKFSQILSKEDLIPSSVHAWQSYLAHMDEAEEAIFAPWIAFAPLSNEAFATSAAEVTRQLHLKEPALNPRVAEAFLTPPATIDQVAERYAQLFAKVDQDWQALCEAAKKEGEPAPTALADPHDEALRQVLYGPNSPCVIPDEPIVNIEFFFDIATTTELWKLQGEVDRWILQSPQSTPHALVLTDRESPVDPYIFRRGNPENRGEIIPRQFLKILSGPDRQPFAQGSGRLEMAQAIVAPDNPLTARVWVNRVWMHHFGNGLVNTPSDFGLRAETPSHAELLDWLASAFVKSGWSTKQLHRLIMLSATYQQQSSVPADVALWQRAMERDPENRLLWRMNARRLTFEQFRDTLIALSGELNDTRGGKASDLFARQGAGFRRSLYGLVDRQFLPTVLTAFDFANPDAHSPQRAETTVAQQALFALNHPFMAERARNLVKEMAGEALQSPEAKVARLYEIVLQREPTPAQKRAAVEFIVASENATQRATEEESAWSYGYGEVDSSAGRVKVFTRLPHFQLSAWQGGPQWPDAALGWVQLTAQGGHAGNDLQHAAIRRWTAAAASAVHVKSEVVHEVAAGDGIRYWVISSRHGVLQTDVVHNARKRVDLGPIVVQPGDTLDFVVDFNANLNSDQFLWAPEIATAADSSAAASTSAKSWSAERDFAGTVTTLTPWEQLAHLLLISNEVMFVD